WKRGRHLRISPKNLRRKNP
ncbi:hypothetical protein D039_2843B, partial [Vibrio parahaemolyticus EKP-028]